MKKYILVICMNYLMTGVAMRKKFAQLGGKAKCRVTEGIIETDDEIYLFRMAIKERLMGMEVSKIIFEDGVSPEDKEMVEKYVRIKKGRK